MSMNKHDREVIDSYIKTHHGARSILTKYGRTDVRAYLNSTKKDGGRKRKDAPQYKNVIIYLAIKAALGESKAGKAKPPSIEGISAALRADLQNRLGTNELPAVATLARRYNDGQRKILTDPRLRGIDNKWWLRSQEVMVALLAMTLYLDAPVTGELAVSELSRLPQNIDRCFIALIDDASF